MFNINALKNVLTDSFGWEENYPCGAIVPVRAAAHRTLHLGWRPRIRTFSHHCDR